MAFDQETFSQLLARAKGDRSINSYGRQAKVDPGYISRLLRLKIKTPPSPGIIKKLADNALAGVTYEELMAAAGYLQYPAGSEGLYHIKDALEQKVAEALQKPLAEFLPVMKVPLVSPLACNLTGESPENIIRYISVPRELEADFALEIKDDAMIEAGIFPGDVAICRKTSQFKTGEMIVAALAGGKVGIRFLLEEAGSLRLRAANALILDREVKLPDVLGVVLMIQKKALRYEQYVSLYERDSQEENISEEFLLEKLSESSRLPLAKLKEALLSLKKERGTAG